MEVSVVDIIGLLIPPTQSFAWVWVLFAIAKRLRLTDLTWRFARIGESAIWERRLRRSGASDKEVRKFLIAFALAETGRSP